MYEYKVVHSFSIKGVEQELNKQAAKGWRLVTSCDPHTHILEREKVEKAPR